MSISLMVIKVKKSLHTQHEFLTLNNLYNCIRQTKSDTKIYIWWTVSNTDVSDFKSWNFAKILG